MKKVVILFGKSRWEKSRPFDNKNYQYSYEFFYELCKANSIQMFRASYQWYDYDTHVFKHAWVYTGKGSNWERASHVKPDLIYDKTKGRAEVYYMKELMARHHLFINDPRFTQIIDDKFVVGLLFSQWSKKSWIVRTHKELRSALREIPNSRVVLKPISGSGGKGVQIFSKKKASEVIFTGEHIIQEFIDSSKGIPGTRSGVHDFRLVFVNNKIIYAYMREPKKGGLLANLAQGGSLTIIPKKDIPVSVQPIIQYAQNIFASFIPKVYTIDIMFDRAQRPWVVELNSMPGLYFTPEEKVSMQKVYRELLSIFQKKIAAPRKKSS